jgi:hypothetical protein
VLRPDGDRAGRVDVGAVGGDAPDDGLGRSVSVPSAANELTLCRCGSADHFAPIPGVRATTIDRIESTHSRRSA